jgi:hypothetical protein
MSASIRVQPSALDAPLLQSPSSPTLAESTPAFAVDLLLLRTVYGRRKAVVRGIAVGHCRSGLRERGACGG